MNGQDDFAKRFLDEQKDWQTNGVHGRDTGWERATNSEVSRAIKFARGYLSSLSNKSVHQRTQFIKSDLKKNGFVDFEHRSGDTFEVVFRDKIKKDIKGITRYFFRMDTALVAVSVGTAKLTDGLLLGGSHIDSISLIAGGNSPVIQDYNIASIPCTVRGGLEPKDFMGVPLAMHYKGYFSKGQRRGLDSVVLGEKDSEPKFSLDEESAHLTRKNKSRVSDLQVIVGTKPYSADGLSRHQHLVAEFYRFLEEKYGITHRDFSEGEVQFLPATRPSFGDHANSTIVGYGQDNWASAYTLLKGLVKARESKYTQIAVFYDHEETGDVGPGGVSQQQIENYVFPMIISHLGLSIEDHFRLPRNCFSLFTDVTGAISSYEPDVHDIRESAYLGSGVVINKSSGDEADYQGYIPSPETIRGITNLMRENSIPYQLASMGNRDGKAPGASDNFHPGLAHGIDIGMPLLSMHRPTEKTSTMDLWNMYNAVRAYYSIPEMQKYLPNGKK